jgi:hypothetical protein
MQPERVPWRMLGWTSTLLFVLCCVGGPMRIEFVDRPIFMGTIWPFSFLMMLTCFFRDIEVLRLLAIALVVTIPAPLLLPEWVAPRGRQDVFRLIEPLALGVLVLVVNGLFSRLGWPSCPKPPLPDEKLPRPDGA